jgi:RNA polymerase sigma-70 factor (ECF subfamily)
MLDVSAVAQEHFARIQRAALVMCGNPWDADDLAQETFLVLARQPGAFQGKSSVYTWLYSVLLNLDRRERRRLGVARRKLHVLHETGDPAGQMVPGADAPVESAEWKRSLWGVVSELPDGQRQALVLRFSEGLRYDEIAEILECPLGTVKSRIFHGLLGLRKLLDQQGEEVRQLPAFPAEDVHHAV